jgi:exodeoxyribonuclease VII large subunit
MSAFDYLTSRLFMYQTDHPRDPGIFTVSDLNRRAKQMLEVSFASVRVEGEISNLARPSSGHWYFTLKDSGAQVRCAMFRSRAGMVKFQPKEGDKVEIRAKVSLYENRGDYQLIVDAMKPAGEGALLLAFEQLKRKLTAEGLFAEERKRPLPAVKRVAIITSPTGAAIHDMLTVLKRRWPMLEVDLYPAAVQGEDAPQQLINALYRANRDNMADAIIIGRGGGSLEDLWAFNNEVLAREIANSYLPVISAVGHEVDYTIADFVADMRAPTPSAAAELISPDGQQMLRYVNDLQQRLVRSQRERFLHAQRSLAQLQARLRGPKQALQSRAQHLDQLEIRLQRAMTSRLKEPQQRLQRLQASLAHLHPQRGLTQSQNSLNQLRGRLERAIQLQLRKKRTELTGGMRLLNSVSPLEVLNRGYSITRKTDGSVVRDTAELKSGDEIETLIHSGKLTSTVTDIQHNDD